MKKMMLIMLATMVLAGCSEQTSTEPVGMAVLGAEANHLCAGPDSVYYTQQGPALNCYVGMYADSTLGGAAHVFWGPGDYDVFGPIVPYEDGNIPGLWWWHFDATGFWECGETANVQVQGLIRTHDGLCSGIWMFSDIEIPACSGGGGGKGTPSG